MRALALVMAVALACPAAALADQTTAVKAVRAQPRVIDALLDNSGNMYVSVKADGKVPWDQFAGHICTVVTPHQARIFAVRVVDVTTVFFGRRPNEWKVLAESRCAR